ncbi:MAG: hypothetical protein AB9866_12200 [Syntrophobacteraceae bacterium]
MDTDGGSINRIYYREDIEYFQEKPVHERCENRERKNGKHLHPVSIQPRVFLRELRVSFALFVVKSTLSGSHGCRGGW